jgi:hypothetical protein
MSPWLTLDEFFYWNLSNLSHKKKNDYRPSKSNHDVPSDSESLTLVNDLGTSRVSAPSVLAKNVKIISRQGAVKVKTELSNTYQDGGLSDNDEIMGEERDVAINSPPKGKYFIIIYCLFYTVT